MNIDKLEQLHCDFGEDLSSFEFILNTLDEKLVNEYNVLIQNKCSGEYKEIRIILHCLQMILASLFKSNQELCNYIEEFFEQKCL